MVHRHGTDSLILVVSVLTIQNTSRRDGTTHVAMALSPTRREGKPSLLGGESTTATCVVPSLLEVFSIVHSLLSRRWERRKIN